MKQVCTTFLANFKQYLLASIYLGLGITMLKSVGIISGGFPGMALIMYGIWSKLTVGTILFLLNLLPLFFVYYIKGRNFCILVVLCMTLISIMTDVVLWIVGDSLLFLQTQSWGLLFGSVVGGILGGMGLIIYVQRESNSGGLMIVYVWLSEKTKIPLSLIVLAIDTCILSWGLHTILSWEQFLYSFVSLFSLFIVMYVMDKQKLRQNFIGQE